MVGFRVPVIREFDEHFRALLIIYRNESKNSDTNMIVRALQDVKSHHFLLTFLLVATFEAVVEALADTQPF